MTQNGLPNRRAAETISLVVGEFALSVSIGRRCDGRIAEAFVDVHEAKARHSSDFASLARDVGILISIALQEGADLKRLAGAVMRTTRGEAASLAGRVLDALVAEDRGPPEAVVAPVPEPPLSPPGAATVAALEESYV